jgi:outer membrane cobalamin receptor
MFDHMKTTCPVIRNAFLPVILLLSSLPGWSQPEDTADYAQPKELDEIIVTATRKNENLSQVAYNTTVINQKEIQYMPAGNLDDVFTHRAHTELGIKSGHPEHITQRDPGIVR